MRTLILLLFMGPLVAFGQTSSEKVKQIRTWYAESEKLASSCTIVKMNDWADPDQYEGYSPEYTAWYDKNTKTFVKISETGGGDWHETTTSYHLNKGKLFFIFSKGYTPGTMYTAKELNMTEEELWQSGGEAKTLNAFEHRWYVWESTVFKTLVKDKEFTAKNGTFDMVEKFNLSDVKNETVIPNDEKARKMFKTSNDHLNKIIAELTKRLPKE